MTYRKPGSLHPISEVRMVNGKRKRVRLFGPIDAHPSNVQDVLGLARRAGIIPESWVADQRAPAPLACTGPNGCPGRSGRPSCGGLLAAVGSVVGRGRFGLDHHLVSL